jgi:hypothetical protein
LDSAGNYVDFTSSYVTIADSGTTGKIISAYTALETERSWGNPSYDTATHKFKLLITLTEYPTIQLSEYFEVEIQSCIVKQITKKAMGAAD